MKELRNIFRKRIKNNVKEMFVKEVKIWKMWIEEMKRKVMDRNMVDGGRMKVRRMINKEEIEDEGIGGKKIEEEKERWKSIGEREEIDGEGIIDIEEIEGNVERKDRRDRIEIIEKIMIGGILDKWDIKLVGMWKKILEKRKIESIESRIDEIRRKIREIEM